jgi:hypothetical protein
MSGEEEKKEGCYAPVFSASSSCACVFIRAAFALLIAGIAFAALFSEKARCLLKKYLYIFKNCTKGNSDPNIEL